MDIDPHLLERLRTEAHRRGITFKELLTTLLRRALDERPAATGTRYRCPTYSMGVPTGPLNLDKALAVAAGLEMVVLESRRSFDEHDLLSLTLSF